MPQASAGESFVLQKEGKPGRGVGGDFGMVQLEGGIPSPLWELQFFPQLKTPSFPQNHSRIPKKSMELSWTQCVIMEKNTGKAPWLMSNAGPASDPTGRGNWWECGWERDG